VASGTAASQAQAPAPQAAATGLRRNRDWHRLWLAQAVSLTGDSVFDITVMLWVATVIAKGRPWAPAAASGVLIAAAVPVLVAGPVAGVWIDRWARRRIILTADACRAVLIASLLLVPGLGHRLPPGGELAAIYLAVAAESGFAQFFNPSRLALLGLIVAPADRPQASGMLQATSSTASIIGPPLAAPLLFTLGVQWALLINAVSFVRRLGRAPDRPGISVLARDGARRTAAARLLSRHRPPRGARGREPGRPDVRALNAAAPPLLLAAIPQHLTGRVMSVFNPLQQVANIISMAVAGFLAGTVLRGMHLVVAGVAFGPINTIWR
jgi:MFS family permease